MITFKITMADYDWASGEYSSWTESRWETFSVRIFLKASSLQAVSIFVFGVVVLLLSFAVTYWVETNSVLLFPAR
jgi:nicastrin